MPVELLKSQFAALERPERQEDDVMRIDINHEVDNVVEQCVQAVATLRAKKG